MNQKLNLMKYSLLIKSIKEKGKEKLYYHLTRKRDPVHQQSKLNFILHSLMQSSRIIYKMKHIHGLMVALFVSVTMSVLMLQGKWCNTQMVNITKRC